MTHGRLPAPSLCYFASCLQYPCGQFRWRPRRLPQHFLQSPLLTHARLSWGCVKTFWNSLRPVRRRERFVVSLHILFVRRLTFHVHIGFIEGLRTSRQHFASASCLPGPVESQVFTHSARKALHHDWSPAHCYALYGVCRVFFFFCLCLPSLYFSLLFSFFVGDSQNVHRLVNG